MSTKFFNNIGNNTLFDKFRGIANGMGESFHTFLAVSGFFRSSGYFKLRAELYCVKKIQILVGINIDDIFRRHDKAKLWFGNVEEAKRNYTKAFIDDIRNAGYSAEIESGILQLAEDVAIGRLEMRVHHSKTLHAKFYLCLPESHTEHSDGWVIMGSSNISDSGLGLSPAPQYELNVAMKDYHDVAYCKSEFDRLWSEGVPFSHSDIAAPLSQTHIGMQPTPFELYMKVLIDTFGEQVEDSFSLTLPEGFKDLSYQRDAVIQGYQMLCRHNGFFLADVVGLGKTVVAAMIARRFVEANGRQSKILVVYPPAIESNWKETFKHFDLRRFTQFISNGSLGKVLNEVDNYRAKEEFDLIIVDESHNFRHTNNIRFNELQKICKAPRANPGNFGETYGTRKKVMLLSATAVNNEPDDLRSQILLFQDVARPTVENISNIVSFFAPLTEQYKRAMHDRHDPEVFDPQKIDAIYETIRRVILEPLTIRRTRSNILNDPDYAADLEKQGVVFPTVSAPEVLTYKLDLPLEILLLETLWILTALPVYRDNLAGLNAPIPAGTVCASYARYRAIEFLDPKYQSRYPNAKQISAKLQGIYRVLMVKRLESSFHAFRCSLENAIRGIDQMLEMFTQDKVLIVPDVDIRSWLDQGKELDDIITKLVDDRGYTESDILYQASDFYPEFINMLHADKAVFEGLLVRWRDVTIDPKLDVFLDALQSRLTARLDNPSGKLVIFSESLDTIDYLSGKLRRSDILVVSSKNRDRLKNDIRRSFDANLPIAEQDDSYNIILSTDVLSEGVNLHRANTVVHYDTPWNVARLMQRIGRINRIGSMAPAIRNFTFYPSDQGNREIGLYENALIKMQGFQSALGEDVQIFSHAEIVKQFKLFDREVTDDVDESLALLREVRAFFAKDPAAYKRIKALPLKSRCIRAGKKDHSVAFIKAAGRIQFYDVVAASPTPITFLDAIKHLRATPDEKPLSFTSPASENHYTDVTAALAAFDAPANDDLSSSRPTTVASRDRNSRIADKLLRTCLRWANSGDLPADLMPAINALQNDLAVGIHTQLPRKLVAQTKHISEIAAQPTPEQTAQLPDILTRLCNEFAPRQHTTVAADDTLDAFIVVSETFVKETRVHAPKRV
jgi:superfamily II DNA or RNA helicase